MWWVRACRFQSMRAPVLFPVQRGMTANAKALQEVTGLLSLSATYSGCSSAHPPSSLAVCLTKCTSDPRCTSRQFCSALLRSLPAVRPATALCEYPVLCFVVIVFSHDPIEVICWLSCT